MAFCPNACKWFVLTAHINRYTNSHKDIFVNWCGQLWLDIFELKSTEFIQYFYHMKIDASEGIDRSNFGYEFFVVVGEKSS